MKESVNGVPATKLRLSVRKGAFHLARSALGVGPSSNEFSWLMGILEGVEVDAVVFSGANVCGYTSVTQLQQAYEQMEPANRFWIKEPQLAAVIERFGSGKLGFHMGGGFCEQTPAQIEELLRGDTQIGPQVPILGGTFTDAKADISTQQVGDESREHQRPTSRG